MSATKIASRYAKSLIQLAQEQDKLERIREDVESFHGLLKSSRDFYVFLKSPVIQASKKKMILQKLFTGKYDVLTVKFLEILTQKQREFYLPEIAKQFMVQYRNLRHISTAVVTVAKELSEANQKALKEKLEASGVAYENVEIVVKKDPDLMGGFILEFGDFVYDASVAHKLDSLKKQFRGNLYESKVSAR